MKVIKTSETVEVADRSFPRRRIVVLERDDGRFSFAEEYYYQNLWEGEIIAEGWGRHSPNGIHETAEIAEREGLAFLAAWHRLAP
jgi:hypothetical protein